MYVVAYLFAIVAANLMVARFGPSVTVLNAFLFIGLDLIARDKLHDQWSGRHLWSKMAVLITTGAMVSYILNRDAGRIAVASLVAFAAAGGVDAAAYHLLRNRPKWQRMNGSNIPAALVDSIVFPSLAFGSFLPLIVLGQFAAKVLGGAVWSFVFTRSWNENGHG